MIDKVLAFVKGYLIIEIKGNALERFINQIIESEIGLWAVERIEKNHFRAKILKDNFNKLRPLLRKRLCRVNILKKRGLPFILFNLRKRIFLFIGLILFVLIFHVVTSFMWFIDIEGLENISQERIIKILEINDINPGTLKHKIELEQLEEKFLKLEPDISWINIYWQGTKLKLEIVEARQVREEDPSQIIAGKDGIITEMIVLRGEGVVEEGKTVVEGQTLIKAQDKEEEKDIDGIVRAEVWYEAFGQAAHLDREVIDLNEAKTNWIVDLGFRQINYPGAETLPFADFEKQIKNFSFEWRNINFPIEIIKETYNKLEIIEKERSKKETKFLAKNKAFENLVNNINPEAVILDAHSEIVEEDEKGIQIRILLKVEENIAKKDFNND